MFEKNNKKFIIINYEILLKAIISIECFDIQCNMS